MSKKKREKRREEEERRRRREKKGEKKKKEEEEEKSSLFLDRKNNFGQSLIWDLPMWEDFFLLKLIEENTRMIQGSILIKIDGEISFTRTR